MAFGVPTDLGTILTAITTKLVVTDEVYAQGQVWATLAQDRDLESIALKDCYLCLRPHTNPIDLQEVAGGGRKAFAVDGTIDVLLFARVWLDRLNQDIDALTNLTNGVLLRWKNTLNSIEQFAPLAANSADSILREPMRCKRFDVVPRRTNKQGWTRIDSEYSVKFVQALS